LAVRSGRGSHFPEFLALPAPVSAEVSAIAGNSMNGTLNCSGSYPAFGKFPADPAVKITGTLAVTKQ
jgi:hypothetical protein